MSKEQKLPKYNIGDSVRFKGDIDEEAGVVLSYSYDGDEFVYRISGREVDMAAKKIIDGVKTVVEKDLVEVKE